MKKASFFNPFSKGNGKQKKKKNLSNPNKNLHSNWGIDKGKKVNDPNPKGKYFYCGVVGY